MRRAQTAKMFMVAISLALTSGCAHAPMGSSVRAVTTIPFQFVNNLILVPVRINGFEPTSFILDTGASASVISLALVKQFGLKIEGETDVSTSGGSIGASTLKNARVSLPGKELGQFNLLAIPLAGLEAGLGQPVGGILGAELFDRFVVDIDYGTRTIQLHDPTGYVYAGSAAPLPIAFEDHTPFITAVVVGSDGNSVKGILLVDTGANGSLTLNSAFVKRNRFVETSERVIPITSGAILAGGARSYVGRLGELRMGTVKLLQPIVNLSEDAAGDEASVTNAGFIGGEVLRRFKLITDYTRARIILEATVRVSEPFEFDMSGMSLAAGGSGFEVVRVRLVIPGSPAAEAGIVVGDTLATIDGVPANRLGLDQIRRLFRKDGVEYRLSLRRGGEVLEVRVKTRRLV